MTFLAIASIMDRAFPLVTLSVEEAERRDLVVVLGILFSPSIGTRGPEIPLCHILGLCAGQCSGSTIYFLQGLSPSSSFL